MSGPGILEILVIAVPVGLVVVGAIAYVIARSMKK